MESLAPQDRRTEQKQDGYADMEDTLREQLVNRKVYRRLMWFLVLLFVCSYLDRINMSFAALSMNRELGLSVASFGIASSIFYSAYVLAEIPSNMAMRKVGARLWIPRIMITWGIASCACVFATGPHSLYALRALVGLAEAGFMPGILLYLTYWFPDAYRARASTLFVMAQPLTILFGSAISGAILEMDGVLGLSGWRWLFILEGIPSVLLGVAALFYLDDRPEDARWLTDEEKRTLRGSLQRDEQAATMQAGNVPLPELSTPRQLIQPSLILLALCYFGLVMSLSANSTWVPQIVRSIAPDASLFQIGLVTAVPSVIAIVTMAAWGAHSDRHRERVWHVVIPMAVAAPGWGAVALAQAPLLKFVGLILCSAGTFSAQAIFWSMAPQYLSASARAVGIAAISVVGMLGTAVGPAMIGVLHDATGSFTAGLSFVALCVSAGAVCVATIRWTHGSNGGGSRAPSADDAAGAPGRRSAALRR
ncbi:MFS transporter [Sphingomonas sp. LB2R24]|uniref:MFS transporter n=1 Tax=Sphingomonas sorbitolis TaxID=3096165 RepID=UPI002FC990B5